MIAQIAYKSAEDGPVSYWSIMALISVNLGLLNLLPIPLLDGGHLTIMSIEALIRRPLNEKLVLASYKVGIALLLTLMLFAFYNDIVRIVTTGWGLPTGLDQ
jgi:regulator of sigma E protease